MMNGSFAAASLALLMAVAATPTVRSHVGSSQANGTSMQARTSASVALASFDPDELAGPDAIHMPPGS